MKGVLFSRTIVFMAAVLSMAGRLDACSVCYTDPHSELTAGARMGVLFLLGVVLCVLSAIGCIAVSWSRRARRLQVPSS